ncbi:hypothetical protein EPUL_003494 [Erysiphe pulchra]|uniref:Integrase catalytic domain-containing protein n=1 Tax=Erysiphe pulchra TaxID=225359 RepID=A0A2S4PQZ4_9PEZI|nr:hypothetical protein EPUL_003494 [Erysiphe pulchra]
MSCENDSSSLDGNEGTIMTYEKVQEATKSNIIAYMNDRTDENFDAAAYKNTTEGTNILRDYLPNSKVWTPWPIESHNPQNNQLPYHTLTKPPVDTNTQAAKDTLPEDSSNQLPMKYEFPPNDTFSTMLKGAALKRYYLSIKNNRSITTIDEICENIRQTFEGDGFKRSMLTKWNNSTLSTTIEENLDKSIEICLQLLLDDLSTTQMALQKNFPDDMSFQNKLMTACQAHPACSIACSIPANSSVAFINNLRSGISTNLAQYYIDQQYFSNREHLNFQPKSKKNHLGKTESVKKRFICRKSGCWSTRHSTEERAKAKERYIQKFKIFADRQYDQYLVEFEGKSHSDNEYDDTEIKMLIADIEKFETNDSETFITEVGTIDSKEALAIVTKLTDRSIAHALLKYNDDVEVENHTLAPTLATSFIATDQYGPSKFHGIMIDTGAAGKSTAGYNQYQAYCQIFSNTPINLADKGVVNATFGIGSTTSIGSIKMQTLRRILGDMDKKKIILDNLRNVLVFNDGNFIPIVGKFGHPFLMWDAMITSHCYLTENELRALHRRLGHPSVIKLVSLLERAGHDDQSHRRLLEAMGKNCTKCQKHAGAPMRFKFLLRDDVDYNHSIFIDVMYIDESPVVHVVDEATRFQAAKWLKKMSSQHVWESLRMCWIDVYLGPPDLINYNAGTIFTSYHYKNSTCRICQQLGIVVKYHKPLRRAYEIIKEELGDNSFQEHKALVLQMATKAINDTSGYDGIVPTLLVFGAFPRISVRTDPVYFHM